ncbi:MAG: UTP--glucose-1-phosphate uridylyltransferase [Deltaproteobacteria bacterium]|nr:UTP--glucose-1-phosphate uridylyltransferase [Deltaproteobacteria bacterium]
MTQKVRKAVIPAAGLGTRLLPVTKTVPKELLLVVDRPATQYAIEEAVAAGIEEIVFIISENKESIGHYFSPAPALDAWLADQGKASLLDDLNKLLSRIRTSCVYQDQPRGLGHAVLCARAAVGNEPCIVILPDDLGEAAPPLSVQLIRVYERTGTGVVALERIPRNDIHRYGVIAGSEREPRTYEISDMVEKPPRGTEPSDLAIIGRYVLPAEIFSILEHVQPGAGGEIQLTDGLKVLRQQRGLFGYEFTGRRHDVGTVPGFLETTIRLALNNPTTKDRMHALIRELHAEISK